uniref:Uncharacterized protein n=1 Tax=Leersia perrieri TaxID=77586 RepID=A0A0D9WVF5_9ORYZ
MVRWPASTGGAIYTVLMRRVLQRLQSEEIKSPGLYTEDRYIHQSSFQFGRIQYLCLYLT